MALGVLLALVGGCGRSPSRPKLLTHAPTEEPQLVAKLQGQDPDLPYPRSRSREGRARATALLPPGYRVRATAKGDSGWAVVGSDRADREDGLWLFALDWTPLRKVTGIPSAPFGLRQTVEVAWDPRGPRLAVLVLIGGGASDIGNRAVLGVVEQARAKLVPMWHDGRIVPFIYTPMEPALLWSQRDLIAAINASPDLILIRVEGDSREISMVRIPYPWPGYLHAMRRVLASPDGRYVAFDQCVFDWRPPKAGIWLADFATGEAAELTYEEGAEYYHSLVRWEDSETLLVRGTSKAGTADLYRVRVRR